MDLDANQRRALHDALLAAFPTYDALALMTEQELGWHLEHIVSPQKNQPAVIRELVDWAIARGELYDLLDAAAKQNPNNPQLRRVLAALDFQPSSPRLDYIPEPPTLFAWPPFTPGHQFEGRIGELTRIDAWARGTNPLMIVEAIGGMGKSMLTWHWTNVRAPRVTDWAGIFWYSFYEGGANAHHFCVHALAYITRKSPALYENAGTSQLKHELLQHLRTRPWLFILDGLERILVAYHRFNASHLRDEQVAATDAIGFGQPPESGIRPEDDELLRALCAASPSKVLASSRLMPRALLNPSGVPLPGVESFPLVGLSAPDAEAMMRRVGVSGTSAQIQSYMAEHFACHPLVIGVVAGLVINDPAAAGDFDRWVDDPEGGAALRLSGMDLVAKRNHILKVAVDGLTPDARALMARISLIFAVVDLAMLEALDPDRPDAWQQFLNDPSLNGDPAPDPVYPRAPAAPPPSATTRLRKTLAELRARGLLHWDRGRKVYDLHPVVRGYFAETMNEDERNTNGDRVLDFFSARHDPPYEHATRLSDVANGLQVLRTYLQLGRLDEAASLLEGGLSRALVHNLEEHVECLALLKPFYADGWDKPPRGFADANDALGAWIASLADIALSAVEQHARAKKQCEYAIAIYIRLKDTPNLLGSLANYAACLRQLGHIYLQHKAIGVTGELAQVAGTADDRAFHAIKAAWAAFNLGELDGAERALNAFESLPRPNRDRYRLGEAERLRAWIAFERGTLTDTLVHNALQVSESAKSSFGLRDAHVLRAEWLLRQDRCAEAADEYRTVIEMTRGVRIATHGLEARLALASARTGQEQEARDAAARLAGLADDEDMAALYVALGDRARARVHALRGYRLAWGDGPPYAHGLQLRRYRDLLATLGEPEPVLPPFDAPRHPALPFESDLRALIERLRTST